MKLFMFAFFQSAQNSDIFIQYQKQGEHFARLTTILSIALITILSLLFISLYKSYKLKGKVQFLEEKLSSKK